MCLDVVDVILQHLHMAHTHLDERMGPDQQLFSPDGNKPQTVRDTWRKPLTQLIPKIHKMITLYLLYCSFELFWWGKHRKTNKIKATNPIFLLHKS